MKFAILCTSWVSLYGATLTISPAISYDCTGGDAVSTLTWSGASGPVDVRVIKANGPSMTGLTNPAGSATTGQWVSDGLQFFLVDESGIVEATATATVRCGGSARTIETGLAQGSYVPLQVGNTWVYRVNNRVITNDYLVLTITGMQIVNGQTYYVVTQAYPGPATVTMMLRGDNNGIIYQLNGSTETVYLDASSIPGRAPYTGLIGTFQDSLTVTASSGLNMNTATFARGVGLASTQTNLLTGSSGGFSNGMDLVEARLDGVVLALPASRLSLAIDNPDLDLTNQKAPNCAIPCYFAACGIAGADPAGTYRPCVETRIESSYGVAHSVELQLFNPSGTLVYDTTADVAALGGLEYFRLPLYTSPGQSSSFTLLSPGVYKLAARMLIAGVEIGADSLTIRIE